MRRWCRRGHLCSLVSTYKPVDLTFSGCSVVCVLIFLRIILLVVNMVLVCFVIVFLEVLIVVLPKGDRAKVVARSNMSIVNAHSFDMTRSAIDSARSTKH